MMRNIIYRRISSLLFLCLLFQVGASSQTSPIDRKPTKLQVKDLEREHKAEIEQLKKQNKLKNVRIVAASDDYWYYELESNLKKEKKRGYGIADQQGRVLCNPLYEHVYYCPVLPEGVATALGLGDYSFSMSRPQTGSTFVVGGENGNYLIDTNGKELAKLSDNASFTYVDGYIIGGQNPTDLDVDVIGGRVTLEAYTTDGKPSVSLMTSDGKSIGPSNMLGFYVDTYEAGKPQPMAYMVKGDDNVARWGGTMVNGMGPELPAVFGAAVWIAEEQTWVVSPNALDNLRPYDPTQTYSVNYNDKGEQMFYQGDYDACISFYETKLNDNQQNIDVARMSLYLAAAYYYRGNGHYVDFIDAAKAFENVKDGDYAYYYEDRFKMQQWPTSDIPGWKKALRLLDDYDQKDTSKSYSQVSAIIRENINEQINEYEAAQLQYNSALATLDMRIEQLREAERRAAEEQAALAQELFKIGYNAGRNLGEALAGIGSSSRSTKSKASVAKKDGLLIDQMTVNGKHVKDLPHTADSEENESSSSSSKSSSKSSASSSSKTCTNCHSGRCSHCNGTGLATGFTVKDKVKCSWCNNGVCKFCHGTGKLNR